MFQSLLRRLPALIAIPGIVCVLLALVIDNGDNGTWGFIFNRLYILLLWASLSGVLLLVSRRTWFSIGLGATVIGGLWVGAAIKYQYLGSQLVAPDLVVAALSAETLLEMGLLPTLAILACLLLSGVAFLLEKPAVNTIRRLQAVGGVAVAFMLLNLPTFYIDLQWTAQYKNTLPVFVQSIWRTELEEPTSPHKTSYCCFKADLAAEKFTTVPKQKPNIVVILEESTFPPDELKGFKATGKFFEQAYPLKVYTVGGGTWVQEISFLHGVAPPLYGTGWKSINLFAPGHLDGRIAPQLISEGYRTKTIYPTAGRFYSGQRFHKQLGMQDFTDCPSMPECAKRRWNKIPDEIFFSEAVKQLQLSKQPVFMFIATMRQHSPHDKDRPFDHARCDSSLTETQCSIMQDYNERMSLSVKAYEDFLTQLKKLPQHTIVVAFGDHIPGDVAAHFVENDFHGTDRFRTYFNIWDSEQGYVTHKALQGEEFETIDIAMLDAVTLRYARFDSRYLTDKLVHMAECSGSFCNFDSTNPKKPTALSQLKPPPPSP